MKLGAYQGFCQGSVPGLTVGDTSSGVVARRMWPSRVGLLWKSCPRGGPGEPQSPVQSDDGQYNICPGRRPGTPKVGSRRCGWERGLR